MKRQEDTQDSPLSLKQLREMNGQPGYWAEEKRWGIICVDSAGRWAGVPFFKFRGDGVNFEYNIKSRRMKIYRSPIPIKWIRSAWEPCELCKKMGESDPCYKDGCFRKNAPQCEYRCDNFLEWRSTQRRLQNANFCPECGRPLTDAAWELLERTWGKILK